MSSLTIQEWCARHRVSRGHFYELKKTGRAPRTYRIGSRQRIDEADDRAWVEAHKEAGEQERASEDAT